MSVDVARGEDVRGAGLQAVVDDEVAALDGEAGSGGADQVGVAGPTDGEEDRVRVDRRGSPVHVVGDPHTLRSRIQPSCARTGNDLDAAFAEGGGEPGGDGGVGARHDAVAALQQPHTATEVGEDRSELTAGVGGTDHADPVREDGQSTDVLKGQSELGAGDRQPGGPSPDGDDEPVGAPRSTVCDLDGVRISEPCFADAFDEVDSGGADVVGDAFAVVGEVGDTLRVGQRGGEVHCGWWSVQAEALPGLPVADQAGGAGQGTGAGPSLRVVPRTRTRSISVTSAPRSAALSAALTPAGPPPMTRTCIAVFIGRTVLPSGLPSRIGRAGAPRERSCDRRCGRVRGRSWNRARSTRAATHHQCVMNQ